MTANPIRPSQTTPVTVICGILFAVLVGLTLWHTFGKRANLRDKRERSAKIACMAGIKQTAGVKEMWRRDQDKGANDTPAWPDLVGQDRYLRVILECPRGGPYTIGKMSEPPTCSIAEHNEHWKKRMSLGDLSVAARAIADWETSERSRTRTNAYERLIKPTNTN
jgi:hypothetical protein